MVPSRHLTRRSFLSGVAGAAGAAILAACGSGSGNSTVAPATTGAGASTVAATAAATAAATTAATKPPAAATATAPAASAPAATSVPAATTATGSTAAPAATTAMSSGTSVSAQPTVSGPAAGVVLFGAAISLTGANSTEGKDTKNGYELWKKTVNDAGGMTVGDKRYTVDIKYYDDESSPDTCAKLTEKLITDDKVQFILGPYGTSQTLSSSAITEKYQKLMVEANGAAESIFNRNFKYIFSPMTPAKFYLRGILDVILDKDPSVKTLALLADNDAFSVEVGDGVKAYAMEKNLMVVYYEKVPADTKDVSAQLTQIKAKNADIFLSPGHYASAQLVMKQARELKFNPKAFGFSVGPSLPDFVNSLKDSAEYVYGGTQWTPVLKYRDAQFGSCQDYADKYKAFTGQDPSYQAAESTACGQVFQQAFLKAGTLDTAKVRDTMATLAFNSFYADIKFDSRGINVDKPMAVEQIQGGKKVTVWPKAAANGDPKYPTPAWDKR